MANPEVKIVPKLVRMLFEPKRYKVAYGGRGSGKSWSFARALLVKALERKCRILCAREVQKSIKDSVHRLLGDQIDLLGLGSEFEVLRDEIRCKNGSQFLFSGLANTTVESIKSFEGVDYCWVEEAQTVSARSWEILIPTIRKRGSEIWLTFNPNESTDPTFLRFVKDPPPESSVIKVDWVDNPSIPGELIKEKDYLYRVDPEAAAHVWGGECRRMSDAQVLRGRFTVEHFEPGPLWEGPYQGADWGFATDPTALMRVWIWERRLYVEWEAYGHGIEIDHTPALFDGIPEARRYVTRADNARPETISYMIRAGFGSLVPCHKWPGCVEDRVSYLRSFDQIVIHPRCPHAAEEARLWSFKVDRLSGDVLPQLVDKHNHCLSPGTMIETSRGRVPIEDVTTSDFALTRKGFNRVLWSGVSDLNREIYRVITGSGKVLHGTGNHKIFTQKGWLPIDAIGYGDYVLSEVTSCESKSNTTATPTLDTQSLSVGQTAFISDPKRQSGQVKSMTYTDRFGVTRTALYLLDSTFTTETATPSIMDWGTSNSLRAENTFPGTTLANVPQPNEPTSIESVHLPQDGTQPQQVRNYTQSWPKDSQRPTGPPSDASVSVVGRSLKPSPCTSVPSSVPRHAKQSTEGIAVPTWLTEFALSAGKPITRHDSTPLVLAHDPVVSVSVIGTESKVYDLTIEGQHEFFANGILVHNCWDAIGYALEPMILGFTANKLPPPMNDEEMMMRSRPQVNSWLN